MKSNDAHGNRALHLTALFVVAIAPFLLHFNALYAPLQGAEFQLLLFDDLMHSPGNAITVLDRTPGSPLAAFAIGLLWWLGGGAMFLLRCAALLAFVMTAALLFHTMRLWLNRSDSVTAPLLCALLFAVSPAAVHALTAVNAYPAVLGVAFAAACAALFLKATHAAGQIDSLWLALACVALAVAVLAHHSLLLLPVVLVALDATRKTPEDTLRLSPAWTAHAALIATALAAAATIRYSGGALLPFSPPSLPYFLSSAVVLLFAWMLAILPGLLPRRALTLMLIVALPLGGFLSFRQTMNHVDPIFDLEQQIVVSEASALYGQLALQYLEAAGREQQPETQFALLQEALAAWQHSTPDSTDATPARRVLGERLFTAGNYADAAPLLEPFLEIAPFDATGYKAAVALARVSSEYEDAAAVADFYAFARRVDALAPEDAARYAKTLMLLGNIRGAAMLFATLPDLDENSEEGIYKQQALAAHNAARALQAAARTQLTENPTDVAGYVVSAESELLTGDALRAFYWLELALRRDPTHTQAWELMGAIFARQRQEETFLHQWGALKDHGDQSWVSLARQTAMFQAWDAAFTYVKRYVSDETPSAEELMAAFSLEMRQTAQAQEWLKQATETRPDNYLPWLALADIAAALQNPEEARQFLDEAQQRNAPEEEIEKRKARLDGATPTEPTARPFEPVRTYIQ